MKWRSSLSSQVFMICPFSTLPMLYWSVISKVLSSICLSLAFQLHVGCFRDCPPVFGPCTACYSSYSVVVHWICHLHSHFDYCLYSLDSCFCDYLYHCFYFCYFLVFQNESNGKTSFCHFCVTYLIRHLYTVDTSYMYMLPIGVYQPQCKVYYYGYAFWIAGQLVIYIYTLRLYGCYIHTIWLIYTTPLMSLLCSPVFLDYVLSIKLLTQRALCPLRPQQLLCILSPPSVITTLPATIRPWSISCVLIFYILCSLS